MHSTVAAAASNMPSLVLCAIFVQTDTLKLMRTHTQKHKLVHIFQITVFTEGFCSFLISSTLSQFARLLYFLLNC